MARNTGVFFSCAIVFAVAATIGLDLTPPAAAIPFVGLGLEPLAGQLFAKKFFKFGVGSNHQPQSQPVPFFPAGPYFAYKPRPEPIHGDGCAHHNQPVVRPTPPPQPIHNDGCVHHQQPTVRPAPNYGPPLVTGPASNYGQQLVTGPAPAVGYLPISNPNPQIDYTNYAVHGGHGFGEYGKYNK